MREEDVVRAVCAETLRGARSGEVRVYGLSKKRTLHRQGNGR